MAETTYRLPFISDSHVKYELDKYNGLAIKKGKIKFIWLQDKERQCMYKSTDRVFEEKCKALLNRMAYMDLPLIQSIHNLLDDGTLKDYCGNLIVKKFC